MTDRLRESVSALMDDEADELEIRRVMKGMDDDESLITQWDRYHLIQAAMKGDLIEPSTSLASRISMAIADEPSLSLSDSELESVVGSSESNEENTVTQHSDVSLAAKSASTPVAEDVAVVTNTPSAWWHSAGRAAIAASVALSVIVGFQAYRFNAEPVNESSTPDFIASSDSNNQVPTAAVPEIRLGSNLPVVSDVINGNVLTNSSNDIKIRQVSAPPNALFNTEVSVGNFQAPNHPVLKNYVIQHAEGAAVHTGRVRAPFTRVAHFKRDAENQ